MAIQPQPYETLSEIRLELKPVERDRYEMVRAWRREDEEEAMRVIDTQQITDVVACGKLPPECGSHCYPTQLS